jgi:hypothetical protein
VKNFNRVISVIITLLIIVPFLPIFSSASTITNPDNVSASLYTTAYESKLNAILKGTVALFTNTTATFPIGSRLDNNKVYKVTPSNHSGYQCFIYANAVYYYLFGDLPSKGQGQNGYWNNSEVKISNKESISYNMFVSAGINFGSYIRTTDNSDGSFDGNNGHSMILLAYDSSNITILEGNADGNGLVRINILTWDKFNSAFLANKGRRIAHIISSGTGSGSSSATTYINKCTYYASSLIVKAEADGTKIWDRPCSDSTDSSAKNIATLAKDTSMVVTALYKNTAGNYWYKVNYNVSEVGYVYCDRVYTSNDLETINMNGISLSGTFPTTLQLGKSFPLDITVSSSAINIALVGARVYDLSGNEVIPFKTINIVSQQTKSYYLKNTSIDTNLKFGTLSAGSYELCFVVRVQNNWSEDGTSLKSRVYSKEFSYPFTVSSAHTCDKGTYMYYQASHPHYSCYKCSICGTIWADSSSSNYMDSCETCNPKTADIPGNVKVSVSLMDATVTWSDVSNETSYDVYLLQSPWGWNDIKYHASVGANVTSFTFGNVAAGDYSAFVIARPNDNSVQSGWASFSVNQMVIKYNANGGTGAPADQPFTPGSGNYISSVVPTREGYTFVNWKDEWNGQFFNPGDQYPAGWGSDTMIAQWQPNLYYLDINGFVNNTVQDHIAGAGRVDIYINGSLAAEQVGDYYAQWPYGTTYEIKNIRPSEGYAYWGINMAQGVNAGNRIGTINGNVSVYPEFRTVLTSVDEKPEPATFNGHTYYYFKTPVTWYDAKSICEKLGGHLVTITSAEENAFLYDLVASAENKYVWFGASDIDAEGTWKWVNNEKFTYSNWVQEEPNNNPSANSSSEDYLMGYILNDISSLSWNDAGGWGSYPFICEIDSVTADPQPGNVNLVIESKEITTEDKTFTLGFALENGEAIRSMLISDITYDKTVFEIVNGEWKCDPYIGSWNAPTESAAAAFASNTNLEGKIFELTFRVKDNAPVGNYSFGCSFIAKTTQPEGEKEIPVSVVNGKVTISDATVESGQLMIQNKTVMSSEKTFTVNIDLENAIPLKSVSINNIEYDRSAFELKKAEWKVKDSAISNWNISANMGVVSLEDNADINGTVLTLTFNILKGVQNKDYTVNCGIMAKAKINGVEKNVKVAVKSGTISVTTVLKGDTDDNGVVDSDDAIYLLYYTFLPDMFPVNQNCDFDGSGVVDSDDAIHLLYYTFLPDMFPLH